MGFIALNLGIGVMVDFSGIFSFMALIISSATAYILLRRYLIDSLNLVFASFEGDGPESYSHLADSKITMKIMNLGKTPVVITKLDRQWIWSKSPELYNTDGSPLEGMCKSEKVSKYCFIPIPAEGSSGILQTFIKNSFERPESGSLSLTDKWEVGGGYFFLQIGFESENSGGSGKRRGVMTFIISKEVPFLRPALFRCHSKRANFQRSI